jgi:hypothetical protein
MGRVFTLDRNTTPVKQENTHFTGQASLDKNSHRFSKEMQYMKKLWFPFKGP